jgi:hypothetical protein
VSTIIVMFSILYFITVYKLKSKLNKRTNSWEKEYCY